MTPTRTALFALTLLAGCRSPEPAPPHAIVKSVSVAPVGSLALVVTGPSWMTLDQYRATGGNHGARVLVSRDEGRSWERRPVPPMASYAFDSGRPARLVGAGKTGGLWLSDDDGSTWRCALDCDVQLLAADPSRAGRLVVVGSPSLPPGHQAIPEVGNGAYDARVLESLDGGEMWAEVGGLDGPALSLALTPDGSTWVGTTEAGVLVGRDGAWSRRGLDGRSVAHLAVGPAGRVYPPPQLPRDVGRAAPVGRRGGQLARGAQLPGRAARRPGSRRSTTSASRRRRPSPGP